jgi:cysteine-rich repeat protein
MLPFIVVGGAINPATDVDYLAITVPAVADLKLETFDASGPGSCANIDTVVTLYASDGTTVLTSDDDSGTGTCSLVDPATSSAARHLAAGQYFVKVEDAGSNTLIPAYRLAASFTALCGDNVVEGAEECDGGAACDANCDRIPACGDGVIDGVETCDDGNTTAGDGCSGACEIEAITEVEPNDTTAAADANAQASPPVHIIGSAFISGGIGTAGDKDVFRMDLAASTAVRIETFQGAEDCTSVATTLRIFDAGGVELYNDDNGGIFTCSALSLNLAAGTYYVGVEERGNDAAIPGYVLLVRALSAAGSEGEPNDDKAAANALSGADIFVLGDHSSNGDSDFFAITVPPGKSIRAEVIEGGTESCESLDIDSSLTLYDATGLALVSDDDAGRGFCSLIDGTGATPANVGAQKLAGGTYYLEVAAAPGAQTPADTAGQFSYRLVVTLR